MSDPLSVLADRAAKIMAGPLPAEVEADVRLRVLDALGCALAGLNTPEWAAARVVAEDAGGDADGASVLGLGIRRPAGPAAFANTMAARIHLYDDTYGPGHMHAGAALTFVCIAVAEVLGADLGRVLRAVAAGGEVGSRVGAAAGEEHYARGFHNTGTCVVFGTAAAAGGLHGLAADRLAFALSLAGDHAAGLRRYQNGGSPANSALHAANAADWGIRCAQLAGAGFPAPPGMLDEVGGFLPTFGGEPDATDLLVRGIDSSWRITESSIKAYPTCRSTQGPATAIDELRAEYGLKAEDVEHIDVSVSRHAVKCDRPDPRSELDARFSIQYVLARLLVHGGLGPGDFGPSSRADAGVRALLPLIEVRCDETLLETHARVNVRWRGGAALTREVPVGRVLGDSANPMSPEQVRGKFVTNVRSRTSAELAEFVLRADGRTPVTELTGRLRAAAGEGS